MQDAIIDEPKKVCRKYSISMRKSSNIILFSQGVATLMVDSCQKDLLLGWVTPTLTVCLAINYMPTSSLIKLHAHFLAD